MGENLASTILRSMRAGSATGAWLDSGGFQREVWLLSDLPQPH